MGPDGSELETALIITTPPNREISEIHTRMPLVIAPEDYETWLTGDVKDAVKLIRPAPDGTFALAPSHIAKAAKPVKPPGQLNLF